jgi:hypothetical protein
MRCIAVVLVLLCGAIPVAAQVGFQTTVYNSPDDYRLIARDLSGDGSLDLVVFGGPLNVRLNNGHGGFGAAISVAGAKADVVALADFNKDGRPDIAACTQNYPANTSTIRIYLNQGGGHFATSYSITIAYECTNVMAADVNGDGRPDLVVSAFSPYPLLNGYVFTYFGNGAGKLGAPVAQAVSLPALKDPTDIASCLFTSAVGGDFKRTGRLDLILFGSCDSVTSAGTIYYGTSDRAGHYALSEILEGFVFFDGGALPYVADVDGNGLPDVVLVSSFAAPHGYSNGTLEFLVNKGAGLFALKDAFTETDDPESGPPAGFLYAGAAAEFNHDGVYDAVAGFRESPDGVTSTSGIGLLNGLGHFTYSESQSWKLNNPPRVLVAADFNHDGWTDLATLTTNHLVVYLNHGATTICPAPATAGVHVCSPYTAQPSLPSPIPVVAAAKGASGIVSRMEIWVDGAKKATFSGNKINTRLTIASGSHTLIVVEYDSLNASISSPTFNIYVP